MKIAPRRVSHGSVQGTHLTAGAGVLVTLRLSVGCAMRNNLSTGKEGRRILVTGIYCGRFPVRGRVMSQELTGCSLLRRVEGAR